MSSTTRNPRSVSLASPARSLVQQHYQRPVYVAVWLVQTAEAAEAADLAQPYDNGDRFIPCRVAPEFRRSQANKAAFCGSTA